MDAGATMRKIEEKRREIEDAMGIPVFPFEIRWRPPETDEISITVPIRNYGSPSRSETSE
jgi:hypothetical protein